MKKLICKLLGLIMFIGFVLIIGVTGALDFGYTLSAELIARGCIGLLLMWIGFSGLKIGGFEFEY